MMKILLVTGTDDTFRKPLLETQGYTVRTADISTAIERANQETFAFALITTEDGVRRTMSVCEELKAAQPGLRVGILAQRAEEIPDQCADAVIRVQHNPAKFLAAIRIAIGGTKTNRQDTPGKGAR